MPTTTTAVLSLPARKGLLKPLAAAMLCAGYGTLACGPDGLDPGRKRA